MSSFDQAASRQRSPAWPVSQAGLVLVLCLVLTGCVATGSPGAQRSVYVSPEGRFQVAMPDDREESIEKVATVAGELDSYGVTGRVSGQESFGVSFSDIPLDAGAIDVDAVFEAEVASALAAAPGTAVMYRNRTYAYGGPALDFTLEGRGIRVLARVAVVGRRTYLLQAAGPAATRTDAAYYRFIDSFVLLGRG